MPTGGPAYLDTPVDWLYLFPWKQWEGVERLVLGEGCEEAWSKRVFPDNRGMH